MTKKEILKLAITTLETSKQDMFYGLLEMSAWMGIPERKREKAVNQYADEYGYRIDQAIKFLRIQVGKSE